MASNVEKNRFTITLASEFLVESGFKNVQLNQPQGRFPKMYATAERDGVRYLIGITGREEVQQGGREANQSLNFIDNKNDMKDAETLVETQRRVPAFVAIARNGRKGTWSAYFDELTKLPRSIPMSDSDRLRYKQHGPFIETRTDPRVKDYS